MIQALKSLASPVKGMFRFPLWLPASKEGLPGVISANPQGIVEVEISLPNEIAAQLGNDFLYPKNDQFGRPEVIVGTLGRGRMVTMFRNLTANSNMIIGSPTGSEFNVTYTPNILLQGRHCFDNMDVTFDEITLGIHNLNVWMWRQIIPCDFTHSSDMGEGEMKVQYKGGKTIFSAQLQDSSTFELKDRVTSVTRTSRLGNDIHEAAVTASHFVHYKSANPMRIDDVILNIRAILNFFSLGLGCPTYCLRARVSNHEMRKSKDSVDFYVRGLFSKTWEEGEPKHMALTLFSFPRVQHQLPGVITRWMEFYRGVPDLLDYYFNIEGTQSQSVDTRFLAHARIMEALHGKIFGPLGNNPECVKVKEEVIASHGEEHKKWLRNKLGGACRAPLRARVSDFVSNFVDMTGVALPEAEKIIKCIVNIRNKATHDGTLDKHDDYIVMDILGDFMSILIQYALLRKIKISKSAYGEYVDNVVARTLKAMQNI